MSLRNDVLRDRYLLPGETESGMYDRVAKALARTEKERYEFEKLMKNRVFFPNTPTLVNAGTPYEGGFSACYTVPVRDSLNGIFKALTDAGRIHKFFGGTGFNFSDVRPRGAKINTTGGRACGPVSVLRTFNQTADMVSQGGKRQGANMGILDVEHPDLLEFIRLKEIWPDVKHFNVSVGMSDGFMEHVVNGRLDNQWLVNDTGYIRIGDHFVRYDPDGCVEHKKYEIVEYPVTVGDVWDQIVENAWRCGDPGLVFFGAIERGNMCKHLGSMRVTNPCVSGDTHILTYFGYKKIKDCINQEVVIWNGYQWSKVTPKITALNQKVIDVIVKIGKYVYKYVRCTPYHTFVVIRDDKEVRVEASELVAGDRIPKYSVVELGEMVFETTEVDNASIAAVLDNGDVEEYVYCFNEPFNHTGVFNGILTGNCGELPLFPYESCNLGSIDLSKMVVEGEFDFEQFEETISWAMRMLDNIIDVNRYPIPEIEEATLRTRKVGLGIMGWHDCLIKMGVPYCSEDALEVCDKIGKSLSLTAEDVSCELAEQLGTFPAYEGSEWEKLGRPVRNAAMTVIAPTGTLSTVFAECSSGIEPHFARRFTRQSEAGIGTYEVEVPEGETAIEVPWEWHIKHQAGWQKWIHSAASKTINMPESASVEDVRDAYIMAWEMGCKGITVYRDGCKDKQVLRAIQSIPDGVGHERFGSTLDFATGCGSIHVTCNELERRPYEVYVLSEGGCPANNEALGKVISKYLHDPRLRGGELETVQRITRTLHKVRCMTALKSKKAAGKSCADIIASRMDKVWADDKIEVVKPTCPECGEALNFGSGCAQGECPHCGWSGCL